MEQKDIAKIKIGSKCFTKEWWEKHRSIEASGSGVGKALVSWQRYCPNDPERISGATDVEVARATVDTLRAALLKAKKKCGPLSKDTAKACDAYIAEIDAYAKKIGAHDDDAVDDAKLWAEIATEIGDVMAAAALLGRKAERAIDELKALETRAVSLSDSVAKTMSGKGSVDLDDLTGTLDKLDRDRKEIERFLEKEMQPALAGDKGISNKAKKLKTTDHRRSLMEFYKDFGALKRHEEALRDASNRVAIRLDTARDDLNGGMKDEATMLKRFEFLAGIIWENQGSSIQDLPEIFTKLVDRALSIQKLEGSTPTEAEKRKLQGDISDLVSDFEVDSTTLKTIANGAQRLMTQFKRFAAHPKIKPRYEGLPKQLRDGLLAQKFAKEQVEDAERIAAALFRG